MNSDYNTMHETVSEKINEIERREKVRILHCVDLGECAWGVGSPNDPSDIQFIYVRPLESYLRIRSQRDEISTRTNTGVPFHGIDLQKALRMLDTPRHQMYEIVSSPIVYHTSEEWNAIAQTIRKFFNKKAAIWSSLCIARKCFGDKLKNDIIYFSDYFTALRAVLACKWAISKNSPPPYELPILIQECLDEEIKPAVTDLIKLKEVMPTLGLGPKIEVLNNYIEKSIKEIEEQRDALSYGTSINWPVMDRLFKWVLDQNDIKDYDYW